MFSIVLCFQKPYWAKYTPQKIMRHITLTSSTYFMLNLTLFHANYLKPPGTKPDGDPLWLWVLHFFSKCQGKAERNKTKGMWNLRRSFVATRPSDDRVEESDERGSFLPRQRTARCARWLTGSFQGLRIVLRQRCCVQKWHANKRYTPHVDILTQKVSLAVWVWFCRLLKAMLINIL